MVMKLKTYLLLSVITCTVQAQVTPFIASALPVFMTMGYYLNKKHSENADNNSLQLWQAYKKGFAWGALPPVNILLAAWTAGTKSCYIFDQVCENDHTKNVTKDHFRAKLTGFCAGLSTYLILPLIYRTTLRMNYAHIFKHKYSPNR